MSEDILIERLKFHKYLNKCMNKTISTLYNIDKQPALK